MPKHRCLKFLIQNEKDKEEFLNKNIEDVNLFLTTLRKINKNKLPKNHQKNIKNNIDFTNNTFCDKNERCVIHAIEVSNKKLVETK